MYYTGWMSLTGLGSDCAFRCTSVNAAWLLDIWSISVSLSPILMATDICSLWAVDPRIKMATYEKLQCFWTCQSIYLERFAEHSQMQFTLFTYFQTSSKTLLFHFLLAHPARSRLLQLTRYINYLLTHLLLCFSVFGCVHYYCGNVWQKWQEYGGLYLRSQCCSRTCTCSRKIAARRCDLWKGNYWLTNVLWHGSII